MIVNRRPGGWENSLGAQQIVENKQWHWELWEEEGKYECPGFGVAPAFQGGALRSEG